MILAAISSCALGTSHLSKSQLGGIKWTTHSGGLSEICDTITEKRIGIKSRLIMSATNQRAKPAGKGKHTVKQKGLPGSLCSCRPDHAGAMNSPPHEGGRDKDLKGKDGHRELLCKPAVHPSDRLIPETRCWDTAEWSNRLCTWH
ncbi:hypothetical protein Y1Q_0009589 [Alligator mississippiensis]|uniref:Uncharacterized protein n=1 Tax=Alligator mississippiensis TaxID=8496 RepID=A0A151NUG3_ALLMI|nr:hypothetical protein Y1Q_0009589 [Alligator mississippiensis]